MALLLVAAVAFGLLAYFLKDDPKIRQVMFVLCVICAAVFVLLLALSLVGYSEVPLVPWMHRVQ